MKDIGMPLEERADLIKKYYRYMDRYMSHVLYGVHKNRWPSLYMELSGGTYTTVGDPSRKLIHLDLGPSVYLEEEADFVNACEVFIGHEVQHIRSTASKSWLYGLNNGKVAICQEFMKKSGGKLRILNTAKQADAYIKELQDSGYMVSVRSIEELVHFIMNSIEDGRIERILCVNRPGFRKKLAAFRGMEWMTEDACGEEMPKFDNPRDYLSAVLNQVLTLSTMSIYQKGFVLASSGNNRAFHQVQELIPYIAKGVSAESCKGGMDAAIEICRILAMDIMEASKMTPLEELLSQLLKSFSENSSYSADSTNEEKNGEQGESLFGKSDLVIELDDEEFDRLEKEMEGKEQPDSGGMRILVKRKHPKEETKDDKSQGLPENGEGDEKSHGQDPEQSQNGKEGKNQESPDRKESNPNGNSGQDDPDKNGKPDDKKDCGKPGDRKGEGSNENRDSKDPAGKQKDNGGNNPTSEQEIESLIENAVKDSVKKGMEDIREDVSQAASAAADDKAKEGKVPVLRYKEDKLPDLSMVDQMYDSLPENFRFHEKERDYNPICRMPLTMQNKADVLKRKLIQVLKNQCEPDMRERKSGILDPAFLYRLAMGNMECFIQKGMETSFNGCAYILMDRSGSMGSGAGSKFGDCCEALAMIEHSFTDILPLKIAAFNARSNREVKHEVIKNWHEKLTYNGSYNFFRNCYGDGCNKDGYSIRIAAMELLAQPYEKKILIVLSDGLPSAYDNGMEAGINDVRDAVRRARKNGIDVVSIYFGEGYETEQFRIMYENRNCIVTSPDKIGDELYKVMKESVIHMI